MHDVTVCRLLNVVSKIDKKLKLKYTCFDLSILQRVFFQACLVHPVELRRCVCDIISSAISRRPTMAGEFTQSILLYDTSGQPCAYIQLDAASLRDDQLMMKKKMTSKRRRVSLALLKLTGSRLAATQVTHEKNL